MGVAPPLADVAGPLCHLSIVRGPKQAESGSSLAPHVSSNGQAGAAGTWRHRVLQESNQNHARVRASDSIHRCSDVLRPDPTNWNSTECHFILRPNHIRAKTTNALGEGTCS
jgi:hypothetical protein